MPSTVVLEKKKQQVADLAERIKGSCAGVVVDYKGINVEDDTKLRKELREAGVTYTVVKNSILKRAAEEVGLEIADSVVEGTTAVATSVDDYVVAARILNKYAEENEIECYISLEERMACGIGACLACVCKSKEKDAHSNVHNKRICKDGPVFLSTEVEI